MNRPSLARRGIRECGHAHTRRRRPGQTAQETAALLDLERQSRAGLAGSRR